MENENNTPKPTGKYYSPTPKRWRKWGDAILYSCGALGATGLIGFDELQKIFDPHQMKIIIGIVLILGFIGKFMSNFFKDDTVISKNEQGICKQCKNNINDTEEEQ